MEVTEQIQVFQEFLEIHYIAHLLEEVRKGQTHLVVDYGLLAKHSPELADLLLEQPEEVIKACELSISNFDLPKEVKSFHIRFCNLPEKHKMYVRNIRSEHINKLLVVEGTIRQKSDVRPQVTAARFECPSCGNVMNVLQLDSKFKEPSRCGCGRKGKFRLLSKELIDVQGIVLEEITKDLEGGAQPKRINVLLKQDLVSPMSDKRTNPGTTLQIIGILKEIPIILRSGGQSTKYDLLVEANNIVPLEEDYSTIDIKPEEAEQIKKIADDPKIYQKLATSLAPGIYGHQKIKEALILQFVGGVKKLRDDGVMSRGDIHVLLIGDPGAGKSALLKRCSVVAPKARFVSGKGVSGAGLCVSPKSFILTNPGGIETIEEIIEPRLKNPQKVQEDIWKQEGTKDIKIQSLTTDLKIQSQIPEVLWKLKSPETMYEILLSSGKNIEITGNTQLLTLTNGTLLWKKSKDFQKDEYIATPRTLLGGIITKQETINLIQANPVVHDVKDFVAMLTKKLKKKYGNLRIAAKKLHVSENNLYFHWVNKKARGNIKLANLRKLAEDVKTQWKQEVRKVSLYNGKKHKIPYIIDADFLYVVGLIAGDGDIRKSGETYSIRFSNSIPVLHTYFRDVIDKQFALHIDVQKGNSQRPTATRTHSKIVAQILFSLGVPISPKSHRIYFSPALLHLNNDLLCYYIAGLYDTDGSVVIRKTHGSDCIDLTTCSETLARQLQLVLLRFNIHAHLRKRKPSTGKIQGKYDKWIVEIRGNEEIRKFAKQIPLQHPEKKKKLSLLMQKQIKANTNIDIIPTLSERLQQALLKKNLSLKKYGWRKNLSRDRVKEILNKLKITTEEEKEIKKIGDADIFWEKIKEIKRKKPSYEYVYDLTVKDAHNFVVGGVLVHNTAAVVKDEFLQGWSLEAGAMVLANKGILMIDEMDKMTDEDRSAMHEGMEQQSFHYDTLFQFSDGSEMKIGEYVESLMEKYPEKINNGKDCLILRNCGFDKKLLSTDWKTIFEMPINRVSKHLAPKEFIEIIVGNGRKICVTPEHPVFCMTEKGYQAKSAEDIKKGMWIPVPLNIPIEGKEQSFSVVASEIYNERAQQHIAVPEHNDEEFFKIIGYLVSESSKEINRGKVIGINFTNNNLLLIEEFEKAMFSVFGLKSYHQQTKKKGESWIAARYVSTELRDFLQKTVPEAIEYAADKKIPPLCMKGSKENIAVMLSCMFEGDGYVTKKVRTIRVGYVSKSKRLCEQVQDLLLRFKIRSNLLEHKGIYKVTVSGYENLYRFSHFITFRSPEKNKILKDYLEKADKQCFSFLETLAYGEIGFEKITSVRRIENKDQRWTYDITLEPHHTFISQNMILHNTISISKANIQATLRCETTILAAANPKFGRFDPYEPIAKQINMPPAL
ncbi:MAG: LAGLIDADG family homing endonuclease, partial [Nanoarchaeota archaeon]